MPNKNAQNTIVVSDQNSLLFFDRCVEDASLFGCSPSMLRKPFTSEINGPIEEIMKNIRNLETGPSPSCAVVNRAVSINAEQTIEEVLFDARSNVKILISQISMHLKQEWREKLFRQIDLLHEIDEWETEDKPINPLSFKSFIRWALLGKAERCPNFGLSNDGNLIASWLTDKDRLTMEFLPHDRVNWIVSIYIRGVPERSAGQSDINRVSTILGPYEPDRWFSQKVG